MRKTMNLFINKNVLITLLVLIALFSFFQIKDSELYEAILTGNHEYIKSTFKGSILYLYGCMLLIMIIQNSFTFIPLILIITFNITVFGFFEGFLWSWFLSVVAATIIFLIVRYLFANRFFSKVSAKQLKKVEDRGFSYILVGRIFPFMPSSLINIIAGLSAVTLKKFIAGTAIGNFIYFFMLALVPAGIYTIDFNPYTIVVLIVLFISAFYGLSKLKNKSKNNTC